MCVEKQHSTLMANFTLNVWQWTLQCCPRAILYSPTLVHSPSHYLLISTLASGFEYILFFILSWWPSILHQWENWSIRKLRLIPPHLPTHQSLYPCTFYQLLNKLCNQSLHLVSLAKYCCSNYLFYVIYPPPPSWIILIIITSLFIPLKKNTLFLPILILPNF